MVMLTSNLATNDALIYALLGYGVVFLGLILLMILVTAVGKAFSTKEKSSAVVIPVQQPVVEETPLAPGSAGGVKLYDVEPKTAAMLMAIVADKLQKPLNELRFISIQEVK